MKNGIMLPVGSCSCIADLREKRPEALRGFPSLVEEYLTPTEQGKTS